MNSQAHKTRAFIAIALPAESRRELTNWVAKARRRVPEGLIRWSSNEKAHLTLRFLGDVDDAALKRVNVGLSAIGATATPFQLGLAKPGGFPNLKRPRVLWMGNRDNDATFNMDTNPDAAQKRALDLLKTISV